MAVSARLKKIKKRIKKKQKQEEEETTKCKNVAKMFCQSI